MAFINLEPDSLIEGSILKGAQFLGLAEPPRSMTLSPGPLDDLYGNRHGSKPALEYPLGVGTDPYPHYIEFFINVQERSQYTNSNKYTMDYSEKGVSTVDANRARGGNQIGSSEDPYSGSAVFAGLANFALDAGTSILNNLSNPIGAVGDVLGAAYDSAAVAAGLSVIDMTRKTKRISQSIRLYLPDTILDKQTQNFSMISMTEALGKAGFMAQTGKAMGQGMVNTGADALKALQGNLFGVGKGAATSGGATAVELGAAAAAESGQFNAGIDRAIMFSYGLAINPQNEVLFDSMKNREFMYEFLLTPRNQKEMATITEIIKTFKFHAAPELVTGNGGGRYFVPPSEFDIVYKFRGADNRWLNKISTCVLTNIDVNYVTGGQFAAYEDGAPLAVALTLSFQEVEILHKELVDRGY